MLFRLPSEEELTDHKLNEFIAKHDAECAFRFKYLKDAYETDYQIFHQKPKPDYKPDNRIAVNFAKYMVDTFNGFFIGNKAILNAYVRRIKRGTITINDVPEEIREEVRAIIEGK